MKQDMPATGGRIGAGRGGPGASDLLGGPTYLVPPWEVGHPGMGWTWFGNGKGAVIHRGRKMTSVSCGGSGCVCK